MRRGDWPVPHFYLPRSALIVPGTRWWALPCPLCPSMSPKSSVSGVVRVHPCARVCARGTGVLSCLCAVWADGGWPVFTLSVFLLVFFYSLSSSSHSAINPNSHLSDQREGWSFSLLIHLQFAADCARQLGPAGSVGSLRLAPAVPARQLASSQCSGWLAGRTRDGWAGLLPCMSLLLESLMHCVSACPLPLARLRCWSGHSRMVHGIKLPDRTACSFAPGPG